MRSYHPQLKSLPGTSHRPGPCQPSTLISPSLSLCWPFCPEHTTPRCPAPDSRASFMSQPRCPSSGREASLPLNCHLSLHPTAPCIFSSLTVFIATGQHITYLGGAVHFIGGLRADLGTVNMCTMNESRGCLDFSPNVHRDLEPHVS